MFGRLLRELPCWGKRIRADQPVNTIYFRLLGKAESNGKRRQVKKKMSGGQKIELIFSSAITAF